MSLMYESAHVAITLQLLENEFYHNTQPETISNICTRYIFKWFLVKISAILPICKMKKKSIWKLRVNGIVSVTGTRVNVYQIS